MRCEAEHDWIAWLCTYVTTVCNAVLANGPMLIIHRAIYHATQRMLLPA
jgi:hypothetical protein